MSKKEIEEAVTRLVGDGVSEAAGSMKRLSDREIEDDLAEFRAHSMEGDTPEWRDVYDRVANRPARVEFPTGEITNPAIAGYILGAKLGGTLESGLPITAQDRFNAQGLEGKVALATNLLNACLIWEELGKFRCAVYA